MVMSAFGDDDFSRFLRAAVRYRLFHASSFTKGYVLYTRFILAAAFKAQMQFPPYIYQNHRHAATKR